MEAKTVFPETARPAATPIMLASAMPTSTNLSGVTALKDEVLVEPARSASMTTMSGLDGARSASALP